MFEATTKLISHLVDAAVANRAPRLTLEALVRRTDNVRNVRWLGQPIWQFPLDAWVLQEAISEKRPDLIVETGTYEGGSAFFFATLCELLGHGEVISIDIGAIASIPHPRITYIEGSSVDPQVFAEVQQHATRIGAKSILVVLDSNHSAQHVFQELTAYSELVPIGGYLHVQDGVVDELEIFRAGRPGPLVAIRRFLDENPAFVRDTEIEQRYVMTAHPHGWLKRVALSDDPGAERKRSEDSGESPGQSL
jgi:cephalosporin hydroxylase